MMTSAGRAIKASLHRALLPADKRLRNPYGARVQPLTIGDSMSILDQQTESTHDQPEHEAPPSSLIIRPWWDPDLAVAGFDPRSAYVERYWLGVLGPSVVFLLRRLSRGLEEHPSGFQITLADTSRALGLGGGLGRQAPINRTIDRACMFNTMRRGSPTELQVRAHLPQLNQRQLARLPLAVRSAHERWQNEQRTAGVRHLEPIRLPSSASVRDPSPPPQAA